jgi:hypothetical protein
VINCKFNSTDPMWVALGSQVMRLEQLWGFPKGAEAKRELCVALANCDSITEAEKIIDLFLRTETTERCPTPPELRQRITAEHARDEVDSTTAEIHNWRTTFRNGSRADREALLREHSHLLDLRKKELHDHPHLYKQVWDSDYFATQCTRCHDAPRPKDRGDMRLVSTQLRDKLAALTEILRAEKW